MRLMMNTSLGRILLELTTHSMFLGFQTLHLQVHHTKSDDQSKITQQGGSNIVESCFGCQASISEYTDTWGWSGSIWDMN